MTSENANEPSPQIAGGEQSREEHSARRLGRQEYRIGRRYSENPYSKMSEHYDQWAAGWSAERPYPEGYATYNPGTILDTGACGSNEKGTK